MSTKNYVGSETQENNVNGLIRTHPLQMGHFLEGEIFFVKMTRIDNRVAKLGDE